MSGEMWAVVCVIAVAVLLFAEKTKSAPLRAISKTIASTAFIACAASFGAASTTAGQLLLVALVFCWLGDVLLLSNKEKVFLGGLVAFLLGHVAYGVMFVALGVETSWVLGGGACVALLLPVVARWLLPHVKGGMKGPVIAYMVVISGMVALAAGSVGSTGRPVLLVAAVVFFISDLAVARERFVVSGFRNRAWGLPLYYGAQLAFAFTPSV